MKICAVQLRPVAGDTAANIAKHLKFIELAVDLGANLIFFPELSLTGYEPGLAKSLALDINDSCLDVFQQVSNENNIIIGMGLPLPFESHVQIGMVWFEPNAPRRQYEKQLLHAGENGFFIPGDRQLLLETTEHKIAPAICYESLQSSHVDNAVQAGADIYLASVVEHAECIAKALRYYPDVARKHGIYVFMSNSVGPNDKYIGVGQSAIWNNQGELLAQLDSESEGIVMADTATGKAGTYGM